MQDKTTNIAILVAHQDMQPYIGRFNYFKNYTLPIFKQYAKDNDIDLILVTDFENDKYVTTQPQVFGKRVSTKLLYVIDELSGVYDYLTTFNSHSLLHKNMPSLRDIIDYNYDVIVPERCYNPKTDSVVAPFESVLYTLNGSAAKPKYDKSRVFNFYKNSQQWWSGPHIIFNSNMKKWWSIQDLIQFQMNDMIWHYVYHAIQGNSKYKMKIQPKLNMLSMNTFIMQILKGQRDVSLAHIMKTFANNDYLIQQQLNSEDCIISYFGGCGSYSNLWPLRPLMMKHLLTKFRHYYYN